MGLHGEPAGERLVHRSRLACELDEAGVAGEPLLRRHPAHTADRVREVEAQPAPREVERSGVRDRGSHNQHNAT